MHDAPDAIILCGGAGLRLRTVIGNGPKGMAHVAGRPFLELLLQQLHRYGFSRAVLAVGYKRELIHSHFGERACGLDLAYAVESCPLGTGGALRNAVELVHSEDVLVMNGDSYTDVCLSELAASHREARADASLVVVPGDGRGDCGCVLVDDKDNVTSFEEKPAAFREAYVNAGIYMMSLEMLYETPLGTRTSLEQELLPEWLRRHKRIGAFICSSRCIDIGTPERYSSAQDVLANVEQGESVPQIEDQL